MTHEEIKAWCLDHVHMRSHDTNSYYNANYVRTFENGDTYEYRETGRNYSSKTVEIIINGTLVNVSDYVYENFGWKLTKEVIPA